MHCGPAMGKRQLGNRKPIEVAVIGGGCASIAAAFELTRPQHKGAYHVTIYQLGWRLGGKGSSGRGAAGRIEEHGLHVWLGCYDNAFLLLRQCYEELKANDKGRGRNWDDFFLPDSHIAVAGNSANGGWVNWAAHFPPAPGLPGDPLDTAQSVHAQALLRARRGAAANAAAGPGDVPGLRRSRTSGSGAGSCGRTIRMPSSRGWRACCVSARWRRPRSPSRRWRWWRRRSKSMAAVPQNAVLKLMEADCRRRAQAIRAVGRDRRSHPISMGDRRSDPGQPRRRHPLQPADRSARARCHQSFRPSGVAAAERRVRARDRFAVHAHSL